ncbi:MAG: deacetylase [Gammaproteobacteria bacterium]|nr:MAG: deacetylase [Gammaproteobacteria bacterium]
MPIAVISHHECLLHDMGHIHPERPARMNAINDRLIATGLDLVVLQYDAPKVTRAQLETVHDSDYIQSLYDMRPEEGVAWVDGDTAMNPHTLTSAERAAGAAVKAVDLVMAGEVGNAFACVRPPGHHAERDKAMGFCFFNNAALAATYAVNQYGLDRVAVVDFDVHHGNGTEHILADDKRFLFCSTFQHPFYPNSGHECDSENVVNATLRDGDGSEAFRQAVTEHWLPALERFAPELIVISAGFDAHQADIMGGLNLVDADYAWVTRRIYEQAQKSAEGRIVSTLEGGYDLHALARSVEAHLKAFLGDIY